MRSLLYEGDGRVTVAEIPEPRPEPGDAVVRIDASAVCGSERHALLQGTPSVNGGHEACGTVVDPGSSEFGVGDRVGLSAIAGCGECDRCAAGQELHCRRGCSDSGSSRVGWHAELAAVRPSALRELPDGIDAGVGALLSGDALGVPARALHRVPVAPGGHVLVIGLGPVGLSHVMVRTFSGADVIAIEPSAYRRDLGLQLGASAVFASGDDVADKIAVKPQLVIECSGRPECIAQAFELVDGAGVVLQSGECFTDVPINPSDTFIRREITYTGAWYYATEDYPGMLELVERGLPLERLCTHDVAAADAPAAIAEFLEGRTGKVVVRWNS